MFRVLIISLMAFFVISAWNITVFLSFSEGWLKSPIANASASTAFSTAVEKTVTEEHTGNFSMILIEKGDIAERYFMSTNAPVDGTSLYQVASLGKWITAWGVMALVEDGAINLDEPVSEYLTRWQLPTSDFDTRGVTVRRLLSHTAGLDDGLGYDGFDRAEDVQSLEDSLTRALDASPDKSGVVELGAEPGSEWRYSGGGYTILQLFIEEVSGQSFADFMSERIFVPLGMTQTTFGHDNAIRIGLAENFDLSGETEPFRHYTALAATSLFTSADDLALFIMRQTRPEDLSVLSDATLEVMQTPHASQMGADIWGLGPMLYASNNAGGHIIGHDGNNGPAINTVARFNPATGDGIVILSTGSETLATELAGEWVFWKTGNIDSLLFLMMFETMLAWMAIGSLIILVVGGALIWRTRQSRPS